MEKVYIDFGTGYELLNVKQYSHDFIITTELENQVIKKKNLSGSLVVLGSLFDRIFEILDTDLIIELPLKVEINDVLQGEFYFSLFSDYNHTEKKAVFSNFRTNDIYAKIEAQFEIQRIPLLLSVGAVLKISETSQAYNNVTVETNIADENEYQISFDISGNPTFDRDSRWDYFGFLFTVTVSPGIYKHYFACNAFQYTAPDTTQFLGLTLQVDDVIVELPEIWIKIVFEPFGYINNTTIVTNNFSTFGAVLGWFTLAIPEIASAIVVSNYIDLDQLSIADVSRIFVSTEPEETFTLSINDICNYLKNRFQLDWFINDDGNLEFIHPSEFGTVGTYDVSAKDVKNKVDTYFRESLPKFERMNENNTFLPDFDNSQAYIEYPRNTADEIMYSAEKFCHDIGGMLRNPTKVERKSFFIGWLNAPYAGSGDAIIESSIGIISGVQVLNNELSMSKLFDTHWQVWRYAKKCTINGTLETVTQRPVFAHTPIQLRSVLPTDIDLTNEFTTSNGSYYGLSYAYNIKTNIGILNLIK